MSTLESRIRERVRGHRVAVLGVGQRLRGDDGAGPGVVDRLHHLGCANAVDAGPVPENYLGVLLARRPEVVLFVDAVDHGAAPGRCCLARARVLGARCESTHAPSLRLLAGLLEGNGSACWLLGIQPGSTEPGERLGAAVERSVERCARALAAALGEASVGEVCRG
jgi:hydrogenase 3 maturation protease